MANWIQFLTDRWITSDSQFRDRPVFSLNKIMLVDVHTKAICSYFAHYFQISMVKVVKVQNSDLKLAECQLNILILKFILSNVYRQTQYESENLL